MNELPEAVLGDVLLNGRTRRIDREAENRPKRPPEARKSDKNTANKQQVRFLKLYFDFNVFSVENRRLFLIEFQLHTNSHIMHGSILPVTIPPPRATPETSPALRARGWGIV